MTESRVVRLAGAAALLTYLMIATGIIPAGSRVAMTASFLIAPLTIAALISMRRRLQRHHESVTLDAGVALLVSAFVVFELMAVVQRALAESRFAAVTAADDATRATIAAHYRAVNGVQLGADVAFDMFYGTGLLFLAAAIYKLPRVGPPLAGLGAVAATTLLFFNVWTFPTPPAEAGLIDIGPITGLWWLALVISLARSDAWRRRALSPEP